MRVLVEVYTMRFQTPSYTHVFTNKETFDKYIADMTKKPAVTRIDATPLETPTMLYTKKGN